MCKYCKDETRKTILEYDNRDSMNISYGQYQGVNVMSYLEIQGNALFLSGHGTYRSGSDCYYEEQGLDCDNEVSNKIDDVYIKIDYCPFCGKKIKSTVYERLQLEKKKNKLLQKAKDLQCKINLQQVFCQFSFKYHFDEVRKTESTFFNEPKLKDMSLKDMLNSAKVFDLKCELTYGYDHRYFYSYEFELLPFDEHIKCGCYSYNNKTKIAEFNTTTYRLDEERYNELIELLNLEGNQKKFKSVIDKKEKLESELNNVNESIADIDTKIESLK